MSAELIVLPSESRGVPQAANDNEVLDANEVGALLRCDRKTVYDAVGRHEIPHRRLGRRILFSRTALMAWLSGCEAASRWRGEQ